MTSCSNTQSTPGLSLMAQVDSRDSRVALGDRPAQLRWKQKHVDKGSMSFNVCPTCSS